MKKRLAASILSAFLIGCADSADPAQGSAPKIDTGSQAESSAADITVPTVVSPAEPGVAPDPGTRPVVSSDEAAYITPTPTKPAVTEESEVERRLQDDPETLDLPATDGR